MILAFRNTWVQVPLCDRGQIPGTRGLVMDISQERFCPRGALADETTDVDHSPVLPPSCPMLEYGVFSSLVLCQVGCRLEKVPGSVFEWTQLAFRCLENVAALEVQA